ncbi:MAG: carboxypeptidase-like regulatory domain-containing protein [bacterium]|nr:carboxypeptidase-like regulatory domain-containing protein [bacterium]
MKLTIARIGCLLIMTSFVGCGSMASDKWTEGRAKLVPVKGVVLLDGKPIAGANVNFHSQTEELTAYAMTDAQGGFVLTTYDSGDGVVVGAHKVSVKKLEVKTVMDPEDPERGPISSEEIWHTPRVYASESATPLTIEIPAVGNTDLKIELTDK